MIQTPSFRWDNISFFQLPLSTPAFYSKSSRILEHDNNPSKDFELVVKIVSTT